MPTTKGDRIRMGYKDLIADVYRPTDPKNRLAEMEARTNDAQRKGA
tara:strand:+ start:2207 stop:2344 length:138 start_codon:yes stop_codon:yes gene_type:complete